ncbi:hypothetical protein N2152v2_004515 [Parachlorella kessleri]
MARSGAQRRVLCSSLALIFVAGQFIGAGAEVVEGHSRVSELQQPQHRYYTPQQLERRQALFGLAGLGLLAAFPRAAAAAGIESRDSPLSFPLPGPPSEGRNRNQAALDSAEDTFQNSDLLKGLLEKSAANKGRYKKELQDRYCRRQAEIGVGDCGGLRYIPGMTKSGVQKRPEWMEKVLGEEKKDIQLRLSDAVLDVSAATPFKSPPPGVLLRACTGDGPGLLLNYTDIKTLATSVPSKASSCSLFSLSIMNSQGQLTLSEICQQRIALVDQKGAVVFNQPPNSCMYVAKLADGTSGFGIVNDKQPRPPPSLQQRSAGLAKNPSQLFP